MSHPIVGQITPDFMKFAFEKQIYKSGTGKQLQWQIFVEVYSGDNVQQPISSDYDKVGFFPHGWYAIYYSESGFVDGKIKKSTPTIVREGKNMGKKNETTPYGQAISEANHKHIHHARGREFLNIIDLETDVEEYIPLQKLELYEPAKVKEFKDIYIEPKFNGTHCAAILTNDGDVELRSTQNKKYEGEFIKQELKKYMDPRIILEGELWVQGWRLQDITSEAKNPNNHGRALQFILFDCIMLDDMDADQYKRKQYLKDTFDIPAIKELKTQENKPMILIAPATKVNSNEEIQAIFKIFIDHQYEGAVIRNYSLPYKPAINKARSKNFKLKLVMDDEFEIIGFEQGSKGKGLGQIMFKCQTPDHKEFLVTPAETQEWRKQEFRNCTTDPNYFARTYLGKMYTVEYRDVTADGIPSHAVGKVFEWQKK